MNIFNQTPFAVETLPFSDPDGQAFLALIVKGTFAMVHKKTALPAKDQMPVAFGDEMYSAPLGSGVRLEADNAPFKPCADVVLVGHAYAPPGLRSVTGIDVSLRVGALHRVLRVFGDRHWRWSFLWPVSRTRPEPFAKMPITYERAFGGMDMAGGGFCSQNLAGRGYLSKICKENVQDVLLPNIEDPRHLIRSPKDHPLPVGFGFYGRDWVPRVNHLGTFDEDWRKQRSPELPRDFSFAYYNAAHPDLQFKGYLEGDEVVELRNLTPDWVMRFKLPAVRITCRVDKSYQMLAALVESRQPSHPGLEKLQVRAPEQEDMVMNLDTLCLLPDEQRFFLIWRGRLPLFDPTALEVEAIRISHRT